MKLKKFAAVAVAAVVSLAVLTACSGGGGTTMKVIEYKDSQFAKVVEAGQVYLEMDEEMDGYPVTTKMAAKGEKVYVSAFFGNECWRTDISKAGKGFRVIYPGCPRYDYKKDDKPMTVPVYKEYEATTGDGVEFLLGNHDDSEKVETGSYSIGNKNFYAETFTDKNYSETYCFDGTALVAIVEDSKSKDPQVINIRNFRNTNVPDSLFELPVNAVNADTLNRT